MLGRCSGLAKLDSRTAPIAAGDDITIQERPPHGREGKEHEIQPRDGEQEHANTAEAERHGAMGSRATQNDFFLVVFIRPYKA